MSSLSLLQKRTILVAARAAYLAWPGREVFETTNPDLSSADRFTAWRRVEQGRVVGLQSLGAMTQAHYARVLAHFQALAGDALGAALTLTREAGNPLRVAHYHLARALVVRGLGPTYALAICRRQFKCDLRHASAAQLWKLVYTIRSRRPPLPASAIAP